MSDGADKPQFAEAVPQQDPFDEESAVYTPSEFATYGLNQIKAIQEQKTRALDIGIDLLRDYFAPVRPGQVAGIVGQTSHYKSGLLHFIEHKGCEQLAKEHRDDEAIIHVSLEESVEEQAYLEMARRSKYEDAGKMARGEVRDLDALIKVSYDVVTGMPIYHIGDSLGRAEYIPSLYLTNVIRTIKYIRDRFKVKIAMIGLDYLQALPADPEIRKYDFETQRRLQVRMDVYRLREVASRFVCPVWVAVQAKQMLGSINDRVKGPPILMPGMYDTNESSDIAQRLDRMLGVWLVARSYPVGTVLKIGDMQMEVTDDLLLIKVNKQRGGLPAGRTFFCTVDFRTNTIKPYRFIGG